MAVMEEMVREAQMKSAVVKRFMTMRLLVMAFMRLFFCFP